MTTDVEKKRDSAKKSGPSGMEKVMIGIVVLGFAALIIYQVYFCATCWGVSIH